MTPRFEVVALGRTRPTFRLLGYAGTAAAVLLAEAVTLANGRSPATMAAIALAGALTFLVLVAATVVWSGEERIVYYHHEIGVLAVAAGVAAALGGPVLPYLDATAVGLGAFLAFGRIGCLHAGCCHGRAHRGGVRYGWRHAEEGLAPAFVGVPLFPVQVVEAAIAALLAVAGTAVALTSAPGAAAALYVSAYAVARFGLERLRGDAVRPYRGGLSQPQWLSLACSGAVVAGGAAGLAPAHPAHVVALGLLALATVATAARHRRDPAPGDPGVEQSLVGAVRATLRPAQDPPAPAPVAGLSLSGGTTRDGTSLVSHVTLSCHDGAVPGWLVRRVESILAALVQGTPSVRRSPSGVVHVIVAPDRAGPAPATPRAAVDVT
jgi:hypothetical protein